MKGVEDTGLENEQEMIRKVERSEKRWMGEIQMNQYSR